MASVVDPIPTIDHSDVKVSLQNTLESFSTVPLGPDGKKKKVPRRIIHFSDGIVEEYSTDEEDQEKEPEPEPEPVNVQGLNWVPWFWHYLKTGACESLRGADFLGEKLAWFFGITSPKYQYAIDEYDKMKAEEEEERKMQAREIEVSLQRETDRVAKLEDGTSLDGLYPEIKNSTSTAEINKETVLPKQGIDNPGLKY